MTAKREMRVLPVDGLELRADKEKRTITGYAVVFNKLSQDLGNFREKISPDAFKRSLSGGSIDVISTFNHDQNQMLGRLSAKTLTLEQDETGIRYTLSVPNTTAGNDLLELVSRGDVRGNSFEFRIAPNGDKWVKTKDGPWERTVLDADLYQVGPVVTPAYTDTTLALRAAPPAGEPGPDLNAVQIERERDTARILI